MKKTKIGHANLMTKFNRVVQAITVITITVQQYENLNSASQACVKTCKIQTFAR